MSNSRLTVELILFLCPLGMFLLLVSTKIATGVMSVKGQVLLSLLLFGVMLSASFVAFTAERRFHPYDIAMLLAAAGLVVIRIARHSKAHHKSTDQMTG